MSFSLHHWGRKGERAQVIIGAYMLSSYNLGVQNTWKMHLFRGHK
uniref:Alternative protein C8orf38 n=1 Tax=Homo sapiens TaxID=9606 RepID=L0R6E0_HUMAN|nr:alternative protein C8orf38 [Homo sapiens]